MSYQPPPDPEKEFPTLFAVKHRVVAYSKEKPARFWFYLWLFSTIPALLATLLSGLESFDQAKKKAVLLWAVFGWIIPFALFIRQQRVAKADVDH